MCLPYASDSGGAPVGGLGGIAGNNADLFRGIAGTNMNMLPGLTGTVGTGGTPPPPAAMPTAGATVLSSGSANTGLPATPSPPKTEPVAGTPAPVVPGNPVSKPPWKGWGTDPLPQTSGHFDPVSQAGHDSLSPLADAIIARRGGGAPAAASVPAPTPRPGETASVPGTVPASAAPAATAPGQLPDVAVVESYIRQRAAALGVDPDVAVAVAKSEGLRPNTWQSTISGGGGPGNREPSFGPFQLHDSYMGADFTRATGLRASDPSTWKEQVDFVLGQVPTTGWGPFHGAAATGIGDRQGLPTAIRGAGPSDSGLAANGAPLIAFPGAAGAIGPEGPAGASSDVLSGTGSTDAFPSGGSRGSDTLAPSRIEYHNKGSTRNKPLSPRLASIIDQATAPEGVTTRVISGGQPSTGGPDVRTGSHRHDEDAPGAGGNAGDVQFVKDGRVLDMTNPADLAIIERILGRVYGAGAQGIGASPAYMGSRTFHVGFGTPAVWGAGGQGKNAPPWLAAIARSGGIPSTGGTAVASASPAVAPTQPGGVVGALASAAGRLGGGGGGGGRVPSSGMDSLIQEFLTADAARRKRLRESLPAIGDLSVDPRRLAPERGNWDVASLASIIGSS